jgi:flagellin-like hook-associated protein FlgL
MKIYERKTILKTIHARLVSMLRDERDEAKRGAIAKEIEELKAQISKEETNNAP